MLGLVSLIVSIVALGVALHAESLAGDAKWKADEALSVAGYAEDLAREAMGVPPSMADRRKWQIGGSDMGVRFEITTEPDTVAPGDLVVLRLVTQKGGVKWTCGTVRCFTDDEDQPAIVLTTGKIPEYDGYGLVCCIKSIPDEVQMAINDDGEVVG